MRNLKKSLNPDDPNIKILVGIMEECLCIFADDISNGMFTKNYNIWVMQKYIVNQSWKKVERNCSTRIIFCRCQLIYRWLAEAACDRSEFVLLYPGRGQCDSGLSSGSLCLLSVWLGQGPNVIVRPRPKGLLYVLYVIKSPNLVFLLRAALLLRVVNVTRLRFFIVVLLPSSVMLASPRLFLSQLGEMDLFAFIRHADPTKVRIGKRQIEEGHVSLLDSTEGRVIPLAGEDDHDGQNDNIENLNEGSGDADQENRSEEGDHVGQDEAVTIVMDEEFQAATADKLKGKKNKRRVVGASGSDHPPKKLREDHGTSGDVGASTGGKSLTALQGLLECRTLAVEVGVMAAEIMPFVTSFVTPTLEREGGGNTDYVFRLNLRTQRPFERFVISSYSSHHYNTNVADAEVASLVRSFVSPPPVMTAAVTTTNVVGASSAPVLGAGAEPIFQVHPSIFADSASIGATWPDVAGPSNPACTELSANTFYVSQEIDTETFRQIYVPKQNVVNEFVLDYPNVCCSVIDQLSPPGLFSQLRSMDYDQLFAEFNVGAARQTCLSAEVDLLKERNVEIANLKAQLFFKEAEATEAIHLRNQVSIVEAAEAAHCEAIQDEQVKALSNRVAGMDSELMALALHLDEEFYPRFLTTIDGRRWIIDHGLRLVVMKCHQSLEYGVAFGVVIGLAIDKGIQDGLVAGIDHRKARRGLADVVSYNPFLEARYVSVVLAFRDLDFKLLSQLESQKDVSITDIMSLLHLEGPSAETLETSLSNSLDVVNALVQKLKEGALSYRLSISDAMGVLADLLSSENLIGEASTYSIPPISVAGYDMPDAGVQDTTPYSPKIVFKKEDLETTPEHPSLVELILVTVLLEMLP
ncbi:hypothetical protein Tco_0335992 [Tanacetum coccineum]